MHNTSLLEGDSRRHILRLSMPLLIGNVLQQLYNTIDSLIIGKFLGTDAFSAVGIAGTVMNLFIFVLAGFCVGVVDRDKMIDKTTMRPGDVVIGLASSGVHSNGFSLVRKVFENWDMAASRPELGGKSLYEALIAPTRIYVKPVLALLEKVSVRGISHITGGGFYENVPRSIPQGLCARIRKDAVKTPAIFDLIAKAGSIPERDMFNTFNMGVGMTIVVPAEQADEALGILNAAGAEASVLGEIVESDRRIEIV